MSQAINNMSVTWSDGSLQTGIKLNVTDTSSNASSLLMDLGTGGGSYASKFSVDKSGNIIIPTGASITEGTGDGIKMNGAGVDIIRNGLVSFRFDVPALAGLRVGSDQRLMWTDSTNAGLGTTDLTLARDAANTLAQRNSTNAQAFRVYNTYTDASNYERGKLEWASNVLRIGTEKLGTGTARALEFQTDGTTRLTIAATTGIPDFSASQMNMGGGTRIHSVANGTLGISTSGNLAGQLIFGNTAAAGNVRLKPSSTVLQARLGDDSAFTNIQGKLTADVNAVAETPTATHTITIYDAAGTGYKVLCVAA